MKKVQKFVAECGGNDSYFSCGHSGPSWDLDLSPETLHRYEANYKKRVKQYEKLVQKENRKIANKLNDKRESLGIIVMEVE